MVLISFSVIAKRQRSNCQGEEEDKKRCTEAFHAQKNAHKYFQHILTLRFFLHTTNLFLLKAEEKKVEKKRKTGQMECLSW